MSTITTRTELPPLPDVSDINLDDMSPEQQAELAFDIDQRIAAAQQAFNALIAPMRELSAEAKQRVKATVLSNGGKMLMCASFNVVAKQRFQREKIMTTLLKLKELLPDDVAKKVFSTKVSIKGAVAPQTLEELKRVVPAAMLEVTEDANGTQLNSLLDKVGENSEIGKVIVAGYPDVAVGESYIEFEPRAIKQAGA